ncbi:DUF1772 domain-containing protein [Aquimarina aquimarini]|uniref:anthrone oxygenase family protein n=1 Tax=Aquimarina aquimarini TaxID=1191734 RepID=UPI000D554133|nr:anthrone oxygenase family protein [Aquimarina aquimarini]
MIRIETIILMIAIVSTGGMTGIFFTWSNAVKPGIGKLTDLEYLKALQSMNRVILNTTFRIIFISAVIAVALLPIVYFKTYPNPMFWVLIIAFLIYWIGVFVVTFLGNIPLNRKLEDTDLVTITAHNAKKLRTAIEARWNYRNLVRTISSSITFLLLVICFFKSKYF